MVLFVFDLLYHIPDVVLALDGTVRGWR